MNSPVPDHKCLNLSRWAEVDKTESARSMLDGVGRSEGVGVSTWTKARGVYITVLDRQPAMRGNMQATESKRVIHRTENIPALTAERTRRRLVGFNWQTKSVT